MLDNNMIYTSNFMTGNFINNCNFIKLAKKQPKYRMKLLNEILDLTINDVKNMIMSEFIQEEISE